MRTIRRLLTPAAVLLALCACKPEPPPTDEPPEPQAGKVVVVGRG